VTDLRGERLKEGSNLEEIVDLRCCRVKGLAEFGYGRLIGSERLKWVGRESFGTT
jgi:hypothetical protein